MNCNTQCFTWSWICVPIYINYCNFLWEIRVIPVWNTRLRTLRQRQDGGHFPDDIFKGIFLIDDIWIAINISLKFVPKGQIDNIPALVQIMAWRRPGDKPLSDPMMIFLLSHTVYPKKYAHGFCFAVLCCGYTLTDFPISIRLTSLAL